MIRPTPFLMTTLALGVTASAAVVNLKWETLPPLPPSAGQTKQPGEAGPFAGVHGGALLVAGGANFPERMPWDGGTKVWWDDVWVLEGVGERNPRWVTGKSFKLPRRLGYGVSVDVPEGVIGVGGHDADRCYADVFLLSWDAKAREVRRTALPALPEPLSFMAGALVGRTLYVAGGQTTMKDPVATKAFWALDLSKRGGPAAGFKWQSLPAWPGPARVLPVAAVLPGAKGPEFFLASGRNPEPGKPTRFLTDAYAFDPATRTWRTLPDVGAGVDGPKGRCVMAGAAVAMGDEVLIFGGDRGAVFAELEGHDLAIAAARAKLAANPADRAPVEAEIEARLAAKKRIYESHPGFAREVLAFHARQNSWRIAGTVPPHLSLPVTTLAVRQGNAILLPSGEIKPGIRTPDVLRVVVEAR